MLGWGLPRLRDLPWRRTRDPWSVLVSEVMLQQTQVERVIPKWQAFMAQYPTPERCAAASLGDVLRLWQGLGYPRRAQYLHRCAQTVIELGGFPATLEGLLRLPGVGPYTARAVLAFAFEADAAVVDTNIARVYARVAGRRFTMAELQATADAALPRGDAWAWNQVLMDIGAMLCRPTNPACTRCPLLERCAWKGNGDDPAPGSAGVSGRQARFSGSDREARGKLLKRLGAGSLPAAQVAPAMDIPEQPTRAERIAAALVAEGLIVFADGQYRLP